LVDEIDKFRRSYPDATPRDVRSALGLAARETDTTRPVRLAIALGLAVLAGVLWFALRTTGVPRQDGGVIWVVLTLLVLVAVAAGFSLFRQR
jgi:hypothetical protein